MTPSRKAWIERLGMFLVVLALVGTGVVMIYSTSAVYAQQRFGDAYFFLHRQLIWIFTGLTGFLAMLRLDYHRLAGWSRWLIPLSVFLCVLVLIPDVGRSAGGAQRWLKMGPVSFQVSELATLALIAYLADFFSRRAAHARNFLNGFLPPAGVLLLFMGLILLQPDLGTAVALAMVSVLMFFMGGVRPAYLIASLLAALPVLYAMILSVPYRRRRILAFLDPWEDPQGIGFQIIQSFVALGSGGLRGLGLGQSRQKLFYLPEAHTDFIFSIVGEELGLVGTLTILLLFAAFLLYGMRIARNAPDPLGCLLATGIVSVITLKAIVNMGVVTGSLPTKGLPLPFISFGGSSLLASLCGVGVLFNIAKQSAMHNTLPRVKGQREYNLFIRKGESMRLGMRSKTGTGAS